MEHRKWVEVQQKSRLLEKFVLVRPFTVSYKDNTKLFDFTVAVIQHAKAHAALPHVVFERSYWTMPPGFRYLGSAERLWVESLQQGIIPNPLVKDVFGREGGTPEHPIVVDFFSEPVRPHFSPDSNRGASPSVSDPSPYGISHRSKRGGGEG
ncbi:unnamed protein product [Vitrella brassicaformis CCMP3155]|uniref:Uncharacterized protein n=1 Tax=Vitrella brassicaformis (strain CCMP3155) TaxID=1169540 RepID=A0A0G4G041_VITBC|nr:unnamed protein product [Vitrella brassicaformis CCMP3155]|eukprot:CEM21187.1 unnamed protein product [Vitrella brassicaformis CCMP3155]